MAVSTTRWRDQPIIPTDYENLVGLVKAAREARKRIVEFDWFFTRDDLQRLQRAVFEWGTLGVGSYKCFDARVLSAINRALGETATAFVLNEPRNSEHMEIKVSCTVEDDGFRLSGHAPFGNVYGYGRASVAQDLPGVVHLGASAREVLTDAVGMLNWDVRRLQEERYRPVVNALFGLRPNYGVQATVVPSTEPPIDVDLRFQGPFSAASGDANRCLFLEPVSVQSGIYLWTIDVGGQVRPWYVGQTRRSFRQRMAEHVSGFLTGQYAIYDPEALSRGEHRLALSEIKGVWPQTLPVVLANYEILFPKIRSLIDLIKFHLAPLDGDGHLHDRIEGAIGRYYKVHSDPALRNFFGPGIKVPAAIPYDRPLRLMLSSEAPVAGLPTEIRE